MKIEIRSYAGPRSESFWYVLLARNRKVLMTSEVYASLSNARRGARKTGRLLRLDVLERKS